MNNQPQSDQMAVRANYAIVLSAAIGDIPAIQKLLQEDGRAQIIYQRVSGSRLKITEEGAK